MYQLSCVARERHEVFPRGVRDPVAFPLDLELDLLALQVDAVVQNFLDFVPLLVAVVLRTLAPRRRHTARPAQ